MSGPSHVRPVRASVALRRRGGKRAERPVGFTADGRWSAGRASWPGRRRMLGPCCGVSGGHRVAGLRVLERARRSGLGHVRGPARLLPRAYGRANLQGDRTGGRRRRRTPRRRRAHVATPTLQEARLGRRLTTERQRRRRVATSWEPGRPQAPAANATRPCSSQGRAGSRAGRGGSPPGGLRSSAAISAEGIVLVASLARRHGIEPLPRQLVQLVSGPGGHSGSGATRPGLKRTRLSNRLGACTSASARRPRRPAAPPSCPVFPRRGATQGFPGRPSTRSARA